MNQDGTLDQLDIDDFILGWRSTTVGLDAVARTRLGDLNLGGGTDFNDFWILRGAWGGPMPSRLLDLIESVPEPGSLSLMIMAVVAGGVARWSRRAWPRLAAKQSSTKCARVNRLTVPASSCRCAPDGAAPDSYSFSNRLTNLITSSKETSSSSASKYHANRRLPLVSE